MSTKTRSTQRSCSPIILQQSSPPPSLWGSQLRKPEKKLGHSAIALWVVYTKGNSNTTSHIPHSSLRTSKDAYAYLSLYPDPTPYDHCKLERLKGEEFHPAGIERAPSQACLMVPQPPGICLRRNQLQQNIWCTRNPQHRPCHQRKLRVSSQWGVGRILRIGRLPPRDSTYPVSFETAGFLPVALQAPSDVHVASDFLRQ